MEHPDDVKAIVVFCHNQISWVKDLVL
jgi:hypothetical protein